LDNSPYPELYRDALPQLVLYREMEVLAQASLVDFRLEDLVGPSGARLQKLLSATLNFGRFHEEIMRQHNEQTESLTKLQDQLKSATLRLGELAASIKEARERQAKEAPERAELENEIMKEEAVLRAYGAQRVAFEQGVDDDRKKTEQGSFVYGVDHHFSAESKGPSPLSNSRTPKHCIQSVATAIRSLLILSR